MRIIGTSMQIPAGPSNDAVNMQSLYWSGLKGAYNRHREDELPSAFPEPRDRLMFSSQKIYSKGNTCTTPHMQHSYIVHSSAGTGPSTDTPISALALAKSCTTSK